ncbi:MAG: hypothetical protein WED07_12730 [Candidatus Freyarchaeum deiterrae]
MSTDFSKKINDLLEENRISKNDIQIWGSEIEENSLQQFISKWNFSNMPFTILETLKEIIIKKNFDFSKIPSNQVERIRIFGQDGDLDLRRDTNRFIWRYIGNNNPPKNTNGEDFWKKNPDKKFFIEKKEALLWGRTYDPKRSIWQEDRVAKARLSYPVKGNSNFAKIHYKTLSEQGVISFVWFLEIK